MEARRPLWKVARSERRTPQVPPLRSFMECQGSGAQMAQYLSLYA